MHQQDKSYSLVLGQSYTYACINRIKCLAGPKGLLVIPCIQGIIGWTKVVNIYNSITEDLGHQSDQTFRGPGHKIWDCAFAAFENLADLGLKGLIDNKTFNFLFLIVSKGIFPPACVG